MCYSFPPPCHVHVRDRVFVVWGCLVHCCSVKSCAVRVSGMLCLPSSQFMHPPPLCALVLGLLVGWLLTFGLLGWLLRWLVGCWLIGSCTAEFGWLVGWLVCLFVCWLVGLLVGWLLASCWGVCVCIVCTHAVWCCYTVCLCVSLYVQGLQRFWGGGCAHFILAF